jgi:hypothetical protein
MELGQITWIGIVILIVDLVALGSIWTSPLHSRKAKFLWTVIVAVLPLIGALAWFPLGREIRK